MTIRKGGSWGEPGTLPAGSPVVASDADAAALIGGAMERGETPPVVGLVAGDLHRTLGSPVGGRDRLVSPEAMRFPVDVLAVDLDGRRRYALSHVEAGRFRWLTRTVVAMNAAFVGDANLGPRSHPGDGLVDVTDGRLPVGQALAARRRERLGAHLPHPALRTSRVARFEVTLDRPTPVRTDGVSVGRARHLVIEVLPDAATIVV